MKNDRLDVLERFAPMFGPPEPSIERFQSRRDRKRRNQRIIAGVVGAAVFLAAVAGIWLATRSPFDHPRRPASPPTSSPDLHEGVGLIGLPPAGATPSTPVNGALVLSIMFGHTEGDPGRFSFNVFADGRVIWQRLGDVRLRSNSTGLIEQRLTPEGVELLKSDALSTGLFDHDRHFTSAHGLTFGEVRVRNGDRLVRVAWGDIGPEDVESTVPTPDQASALRRLDTRLEDAASWLPASAWADRKMKPYIPSRYWICYGADQGVGLGRVLASLPQPVEDLLGSWERTHQVFAGRPGPGQRGLENWCSHVTTQQARALAKLLDNAHIGVFESGSAPIYVSRHREPYTPEVMIDFSPILPHDV
jgi:hypothetical protein